MDGIRLVVIRFRPPLTANFAAALLLLAAFPACNRSSNTIAIIPRACGTALWEPEHAGATHVARRKGFNIYWNASPREDDVAGQIDFLEKVVARGYAGIILTPDQTLPLRSPVRRIVSRKARPPGWFRRRPWERPGKQCGGQASAMAESDLE